MKTKKTFRKKPLRKASAKAQSAMEYLMTYGWAILIISVVLAALFQLGVFNPMTFAPKAPPGSCQVFRPNGPYTTSFINLEGICSGELPQYVAQFNGNGYIQANVLGLPIGAANRTVTLWLYTTNVNQQRAFFGYGVTNNYQNFYAVVGGAGGSNTCNVPNTSSSIWTDQWGCTVTGPAPNPLPPSWIFLVMSYNGSYSISYTGYNGKINGPFKSINSPFTAATPYTPFYIGTDYEGWNSAPFIGEIANVQLYNTSLSANEIQALYLEGIGGAPIDLQHIVGWWPLNGNANDYSGNGNNDQISNVNFVSNWWSGYTPP